MHLQVGPELLLVDDGEGLYFCHHGLQVVLLALDLAQQLEEVFGELAVAEELLGCGADVLGLALFGLVELFDDAEGDVALVAEGGVEGVEEEEEGGVGVGGVLQCVQEVLEEISQILVGVHHFVL
jgi:hypothetical protein